MELEEYLALLDAQLGVADICVRVDVSSLEPKDGKGEKSIADQVKDLSWAHLDYRFTCVPFGQINCCDI